MNWSLGLPARSDILVQFLRLVMRSESEGRMWVNLLSSGLSIPVGTNFPTLKVDIEPARDFCSNRQTKPSRKKGPKRCVFTDRLERQKPRLF